MIVPALAQCEKSVRSAVEAQDYPRAQIAFQEYAAALRSRSRTLEEIEAARALLDWGVKTVKAHKAALAEELMLLKSVVDAYELPRRFHTWRVEG